MELKEYATEMEDFAKTGVCKSHHNIVSKPFKTDEGEFQIVSCVVCKDASAKIGEKTVRGTLSKVLNELISRGINKAERTMAETTYFAQVMKKTIPKEISVGNMFDKVIQTDTTPTNLFANIGLEQPKVKQ